MLDPKWLRTEPEAIAQRLAQRGFQLDVATLEQYEGERKQLQTDTQQLQNTRNEKSKQIGQLKSKGQDIEPLRLEMTALGEDLAQKEQALQDLQTKIETYCLTIPNVPHESVPAGRDENDNVEIRRWGEPPQFTFTPRDHVDLGAHKQRIDAESGVKLSGSRFMVLQGSMARLHRALTQFMMDCHTEEHGYREVYVPYLVHTDCFFGTGQFPKLRDDQFGIQGSELWLIPTAEVPVTNLCRDKILDAEELPKKWVCHTPCFRKEAGTYGKDMRGMMRCHQFDKVELVQITRPQESLAVLESLTKHAETILQKLKLAYRVMVLCSGDMGFSATKTYDLEVWLPGQNRYREISSCSNFQDFQARRMQARWRNPGTHKTEYVHTVNGSGLAVGRALIAVVENYQDAEGNVHIPEVLQPYMGGATVIEGAH